MISVEDYESYKIKKLKLANNLHKVIYKMPSLTTVT